MEYKTQLLSLLKLKRLLLLKQLGFTYYSEQSHIPVFSSGRPIDALMRDISECNLCQLSKVCEKKLPNLTTSDKSIVCLSLTPITKESHYRLLETFLTKTVNMRLGEIYLSSVIKCIPQNHDMIDQTSINQCAPFMHEELSFGNYHTILALGKEVFSSICHSKALAYETYLGKTLRLSTHQIVVLQTLDFYSANPKEFHNHCLTANFKGK